MPTVSAWFMLSSVGILLVLLAFARETQQLGIWRKNLVSCTAFASA